MVFSIRAVRRRYFVFCSAIDDYPYLQERDLGCPLGSKLDQSPTPRTLGAHALRDERYALRDERYRPPIVSSLLIWIVIPAITFSHPR